MKDREAMEVQVEMEGKIYTAFNRDLKDTEKRIMEFELGNIGSEIFDLKLYRKAEFDRRFFPVKLCTWEIRSLFGAAELLKFIRRWSGIWLNAGDVYEFRRSGKKFKVEF